MPSATSLYCYARVGLTQEADDLLFGSSLLHVQSPWVGELESELLRYSKSGVASFTSNGLPKEHHHGCRCSNTANS